MARLGPAATAAVLLVLGGCVNDRVAETSQCTALQDAPCNFQCEIGDVLRVVVEGSGEVRGSASCGGVTVGCEGFERCEDPETPRVPAPGEGTCVVAEGREARCSAGH